MMEANDHARPEVACAASHRPAAASALRQPNVVDGPALVLVPKGEFGMGSERAAVLDLWRERGWDQRWFAAHVGGDDWVGELHPHEVELTAFWMYEQPVTIAEYHRFMQETGREARRVHKLGLHAAASYSWSRPPRRSRRVICSG